MKPRLQAILLADHIYQDKSGKHVIAGTFNRWLFQKIGAQPKDARLAGVSVTPMIDEDGTVTLSGDIVDPGTEDTFTLEVHSGLRP